METLITNKKDKLVEYFINNPATEVHLRELARNVKISFPWVRKIVGELTKEGYLVRKKQRGLVLVKADRDSVLFRELKRSYNLFSLYKSKLVNELVESYNKPETIVLFGSYSKGEDTEESDIDIAIITERHKDVNLAVFERRLHRKIKVLEIQRPSIEKEFWNTLINGIVLYGYLESK